MNVFFVYVHPNPQSLNATLKDHAVRALEIAGHQVQVSDLYAMKWKAVADAGDFPERDRSLPLDYGSASGEAYQNGTQAKDIAAEQEKLLWADAVIFQFPMWWYGMPAILKGWVERVYALGFAYGQGLHDKTKWGKRFGEGILEGRRSMVCTTLGGRAAQYGPRGVNGQIDDLLWPIHHGILFYPGMTVLPPTVFYEVWRRIDEKMVQRLCEHYESRVLSLMETEPIPFRMQNGGDYDSHQTLKPGLENGSKGLLIHQKEPVYLANVELTRGSDFSPLTFARDSRSLAIAK
jgi:NAD(P)H dehydrogenase (quinone)